MIHATEALRLPSAHLTAAEKAAADALEGEIDAHVRLNMERRGVDFKTTEKRPNVVAEVNQRLKAAGYNPQWQVAIEEGMFSTNRVHAGFILALSPTDESYRHEGILYHRPGLQ